MREYHSIEAYRSMGWGDKAEDFFVFMEEVNAACKRHVGMSVFDLPDQEFAAAFEDGVDPWEFAEEFLEDEGFGI